MKKNLLMIIGFLNIAFGSIFTVSIIGSIIGVPLIISGALFLNYSSLDDNELVFKRSSIKIWSIIFIFINFISAILGLIVLTQIDNNKKMNPGTFKINFFLNLGTFLILIACIMLVNTSLDSVFDYVKVVLLIVFSIIFFVLSRVLSRSEKLKFTSYVYWIIGCILFLSFFYACGYYNIFGNLYSVSGIFKNLFMSSLFIIATILLYLSYKIFKSISFVRLSFFTLYTSIILLFIQLSSQIDTFAVMFTGVILISSLVSNYKSKSILSSNLFIFNMLISFIYFVFIIILNILGTNFMFVLISSILYILNLFVMASKYKGNVVNICTLIVIPTVILLYCYKYAEFDIALICSSLSLFAFYLIFYFSRNKHKLFVPVLIITNLALFANYIVSYFSYNQIYVVILSLLLIGIYVSIMFIKDYEKKYLVELIIQPVKVLLLCFALSYFIYNVSRPLGFMSYIIIWSNVCLLFSFLNKNKIIKNIYFILSYSLLMICIVPINMNIIFRVNLLLMWIIGYIILIKDKSYYLGPVNYIFYFMSLLYTYILFNYISFTVQFALINIILFALFAYLVRDSKVKVFTSLMFLLLPYYSLINIVDISNEILNILNFAPYIFYVYLFTYLFTKNNNVLSLILEVVIGLSTFIILILQGTFESALFVGILSLLMIIYDIIKSRNSLLIIGIVSLILNIVFNIIKYWSYIPIWSYLLIGGIAIIIVVTVKEVKK